MYTFRKVAFEWGLLFLTKNLWTPWKISSGLWVVSRWWRIYACTRFCQQPLRISFRDKFFSWLPPRSMFLYIYCTKWRNVFMMVILFWPMVATCKRWPDLDDEKIVVKPDYSNVLKIISIWTNYNLLK